MVFWGERGMFFSLDRGFGEGGGERGGVRLEIIDVGRVEGVASEGRRLLTAEQLESYLGQRGNVEMVRLGSVLASRCDECVDGRQEKRPIVGGPGGGLVRVAEVIHALGEEGKRLDNLEIRNIFRWYVGRFGSFYMHTDSHAIEKMVQRMRGDEVFARHFEGLSDEEAGGKLRGWLKTGPDEGLQVQLINYLTDPEFTGCGHLKLMLQNPERYGVSRKVLRALVREFYDLLWNGVRQRAEDLADNLVLEVLEGDHQEGAVVSVIVEGLNDETMVPAVRPTDGEVAMFVDHPGVREYLFAKVLRALVEDGPIERLRGLDVNRLVKLAKEKADRGLGATVEALAAGLPKFEVKVVK